MLRYWKKVRIQLRLKRLLVTSFVDPPNFDLVESYFAVVSVANGRFSSQEITIHQKLLPQIFINTFGASIVDEPKIDAEMRIIEDKEELGVFNIGIELKAHHHLGFKSLMVLRQEIILVTIFPSAYLGSPRKKTGFYGPFLDNSLLRRLYV